MLTKFYNAWPVTRLIALAIAAVIALFAIISGHSFELDIHYTGPGSEAESLSHDLKDQQNKEAADRYQDGSTDPKDAQGASDYYRDHGA